MNTTELLRLILKGMSKESIELTHVEIYEEAVDINNQVKVCLVDDNLSKYLVHKVNKGGGFSYYTVDEMVDKVIELLKPTMSKGDYITNGEKSGVLIEVESGRYHIVDFRPSKTIYCQTNSLKELQNMGWRKG